jgi:hypothetical protein
VDETARERVVLILDALTTSSVTGTITFGEGSIPDPDPLDVYPTLEFPDGLTGETVGENWAYSPFPGFPFALVASERRGDRLVLSFVPKEIWAEWCGTITSDSELRSYSRCDCTLTPCVGLEEPLRRVELLLIGNTMDGEMSRPPGNLLGGVPSIRLHLVE